MSPEESQLQRLARVKHVERPGIGVLGPEMVGFFKNCVEKRRTKFTSIAASWTQLIPETLSDHCALESFSRGSLTVVVDSASHLYELKHLLLAGLQQQLMIACKSAGLRKITLKPGRWYEGEESGPKKLRFD